VDRLPLAVVADDNLAFAELIAAGLRGSFEVRVVENGRKALELCLAGAAVLVTDIGMPELDGMELLKELKKDARTAKLPVVIATATHFQTASKKKYESDPQVRAIYCKPFQLDELVKKVESLIEKPS
jgi:CheY-like chemotaxis protein